MWAICRIVQYPTASNQGAAPAWPKGWRDKVRNGYSTQRWKCSVQRFWAEGPNRLQWSCKEETMPHSPPSLWSPASISPCHHQRKGKPANKVQAGHLQWHRTGRIQKAKVIHLTPLDWAVFYKGDISLFPQLLFYYGAFISFLVKKWVTFWTFWSILLIFLLSNS